MFTRILGVEHLDVVDRKSKAWPVIRAAMVCSVRICGLAAKLPSRLAAKLHQT